MAGCRYWIYILASKSGTLYIGVTNNLERRIWEHKQKMIIGFSQKYGCDKLVYFEEYKEIDEAIAREKQLKKWSREKKVKLIRMINPHWLDLLKEIPRLRSE
jgi:putative endonuclease